MTDVFKCRNVGTKCCSPKSLIRDMMGHKEQTTLKPTTVQYSQTQNTTAWQPISESQTGTISYVTYITR